MQVLLVELVQHGDVLEHLNLMLLQAFAYFVHVGFRVGIPGLQLGQLILLLPEPLGEPRCV